MASSTTSRLLNFSKNSETIQSLIHRHLLRTTTSTSTSTSINQLLNPTPDRQTPNLLKTTEKSPNAAEMLSKKKNPVADNILGFPGFDRSGILQASVDSDGSLDFVSDTDLTDCDGDFGFDFGFGDFDDDDDDSDDTEEDLEYESASGEVKVKKIVGLL